MTSPQIFISHSSKDVDLAAALVRCIENGLQVPDGAIRCTSVPGYKLDVGANANDTLRDNLAQCTVVVGLLTEHSLESGYVVMELGAAWGLRKTTCPILAPGVDFKRIPGPLAVTHAVRADNAPDIAQLLEVLHKSTGFPERNRARATEAVDAFLKATLARP